MQSSVTEAPQRTFGELFQAADKTKEKHVPVIKAPEKVKKGEMFSATVTVGSEIAHPNTTAHHIVWIALSFLPDGAMFPYQIARSELLAHGASVKGPDTSGVYAHHEMCALFKTVQSGTLYATSYCNIHGLWQYSQRLEVEE
jgi:superoxide reductase